MTINVAVKCPDGIVMGADSLIAIPADTLGSVAALIPYFTKLFPIKPFSAGAMINGVGAIGGRTVEDIILEFGDESDLKHENYSLEELSSDLQSKIQSLMDDYIEAVASSLKVTIESFLTEKKFNALVPNLEVIVGGYSRGANAHGKRYGELYSIRWHTSNIHVSALENTRYTPLFKPLYNKDTEFGTHYGGQPWMLDRYLYGIDDNMIELMYKRRDLLFNDTCKYILNELRKRGITIPEDIQIDVPNDLADFDIYKLLSNYKRNSRGLEGAQQMKYGMITRLRTAEGYFSLQTAVDFCNFLLSCAYAQSMFSLVIPTVGSEMRIASITRNEGFQLRRQWEIRTPGPPFAAIGK